MDKVYKCAIIKSMKRRFFISLLFLFSALCFAQGSNVNFTFTSFGGGLPNSAVVLSAEENSEKIIVVDSSGRESVSQSGLNKEDTTSDSNKKKLLRGL